MTDLKFYMTTNIFGFTQRAVAGPGLPPVPDSAGSVGPTHFFELVQYGYKLHPRPGTSSSENGTMHNFFQGNPQHNKNAFDPRVIYDPHDSRWFAISGDFELQMLRLKVSSATANPYPTTGWTLHLVSATNTTDELPDWPTLVVDKTGVYSSIIRRAGTGFTVIKDSAVLGWPKLTLLGGTASTSKLEVSETAVKGQAVQPALNLSNGHPAYVWFIVKTKPTGTGIYYQPGTIQYRRAKWAYGQLAWVDDAWKPITYSVPRHFDFDSASVYAPSLGSSTGLNMNHMGSRLFNAIIQDTVLWTCHVVGFDGNDNDYDGNESGTGVDRSAVQWWKFNIASDGSLSYNTSGLILDTAATAPYWYQTPSIMANSQGDMLLGFAGSRSTEYVAAFCYGRLANGTFPDRVQLIQPGWTLYGAAPQVSARWGDYSTTSLDPSESRRFWTIQSFIGPNNEWASIISSIERAP
jgi:hypothetical protein